MVHPWSTASRPRAPPRCGWWTAARVGDYLDRRDSDGDGSNGDDGHAMLLANWNATTSVAVTLDGPWNINFRPVNVAAEETSGSHDYCVGRIPEND